VPHRPARNNAGGKNNEFQSLLQKHYNKQNQQTAGNSMGLVMGPSANAQADQLSLPGLGNLSSALSGLVTGG